jgi:hypothetical protein
MATQVNTSLPLWLAGGTYDGNSGNDLRNSGVTAFMYDQGIVNGPGAIGSTIGVLGGVVGGSGLLVSAGTGMNVSLQPGSFVVPNTATPTAGGYISTLPSTAVLAVQTADPSNPRIDIIVAMVSDVGTSSSFGAVQIITGVAAPSPSVPAAPANSITLSKLTVPAAATSITGGMLADQRPFTTTTGGVLKAPKGSVIGYSGQIAYDPPSGSFYHNNNTSSATQMHVLPWQPVVAKVTAPITVVNDQAEHTVITLTITTDGFTDIACSFKCPGVSSVAVHATTWIRPQFRIYLDNTVLDSLYGAEVQADVWMQAGVAWTYPTSPATADTPSAGTHTVKVTVQNTQSTIGYDLGASVASSILLRVEPVAM